MSPEQMEKLLDRLAQKLVDEGYHQHRGARPTDGPARRRAGGADRKVKFEVTDKALDFLGFKTLKDLLGSLGKSSFGRMIRATWPPASKPAAFFQAYEFGDTLNLDVSETLFSAIQREGLKVPLELEYPICTSTSPSIKAPAPPC
jgi:Ca-activated chloride channel homolog